MFQGEEDSGEVGVERRKGEDHLNGGKMFTGLDVTLLIKKNDQKEINYMKMQFLGLKTVRFTWNFVEHFLIFHGLISLF